MKFVSKKLTRKQSSVKHLSALNRGTSHTFTVPSELCNIVIWVAINKPARFGSGRVCRFAGVGKGYGSLTMMIRLPRMS